MKKFLSVTAAAFVLLACSASPTPASGTKMARYVADAGNGRVYRFCDSGRLVYVYDGYKAGGIAISDLSCAAAD